MNAFEEAWRVLKALEEQQLVSGPRGHIGIDTYGHLMDVDEYGELPLDPYVNLGTMHPAALGMARRQQAKQPVGTVQVQRLERPRRFNSGIGNYNIEYGIQERTGNPDFAPYDERNIEDIKAYGALGALDERFPKVSREGYDLRYSNMVKPDYPDRDPIYLDTPLQLEGGM